MKLWKMPSSTGWHTDMRQVDSDELVWLIEYALGRLPASIRAMMADSRVEQQRKGLFFAAQKVAGHLGRLEILSSAPPPPPFRNGGLDGGSRVPPMDDWSD